MRQLQVGALAADSGCSLVARKSAVEPDFIVGENAGNNFVAARWRRSHVGLTDAQPLHEHLLSYCVAGTASCTVYADGVRMQAQQRPRSMTLLRAEQLLQWELEAPEDVVHVHLYMSPQTVATFACETLGHDEPPLLRNAMNIRDPWFDGFFRLLISEYESYAHDLRLADSLFLDQAESVLVGYLVSRYAEGAHKSPGAVSRVSALRPSVLRRVEAFVEENLGSTIRLASLAQIAAMSSGHFARAFHLATGTTPHQYVVARRLDKAREMLRQKSMPIAHIAQQCGFSGAAHFSMTFRDHHAITPSQYRQMQ